MTNLRWLLVVAALGLVPATARAADVRLGVGADYLTRSQRGMLHVTLAVDGPLAKFLKVGGRFGALLTSEPTNWGVPIDLYLRLVLGDGRVYLDGLVGPWLMFGGGDPLTLHGAVGFGLVSGSLTFGLEVGAISSFQDPHAGIRLALKI